MLCQFASSLERKRALSKWSFQPLSSLESVEAGDLMVDATSSHAFQRIFFDMVAEGRTLAGRPGRLVSTKSTLLAETLKGGPPQTSRFLKVEQSNSSIIYDDKIYLKLFRKLEEGINPDLELTKQLSDKCGFPYVPTYLGDIQYIVPGQEAASLVMAQSFTPSEQDGWSHTLGAVSRYFDRVLDEPQLPPAPSLVFGRKFRNRSSVSLKASISKRCAF